jgi:hypothetical protein
MNHGKVIALCRQLIKAVDKPSAGVDIWNDEAEIALKDLRKEIGDLEVAAALVRTVSLTLELFKPVITEVKALRRFRDGESNPIGEVMAGQLCAQDCSKLDNAIATADEGLVLVLSVIPESPKKQVMA